MRSDSLQFRDAIDCINGETESVRLVVDRQFHWSIDVAFLFVAADVDVAMVRPAVSEAVNQPGIAMEVEDDWLVDGKERIEVRVC